MVSHSSDITLIHFVMSHSVLFESVWGGKNKE